jgi:succinylglutamate desuccinylase
MKVTTLGDGPASVAIVAAIHGDEPAGVRPIDRLLEETPVVERPVKLIVANEEALERNVRYLDEDLNRAFPGSPDAGTHEGRLAARLETELEGCTTLSIHSTQSHDEPFAVANRLVDPIRDLIPRLPVTAVVETGSFVQGRLFESVGSLVEVEAGLQGTDEAAENADRIARAFLVATGVLPGTVPTRELPVFRLTDQVSKVPADRYDVFVENFERVAAGEAFAAADGVETVADEEFYPVLMSPDGYGDVYGYAADRVGTIGGTDP